MHEPLEALDQVISQCKHVCHGVVRSFFSFLNCGALGDQGLSKSLYSSTVGRQTKTSVPPDNSIMDVPYMTKLSRGKTFAVGMQLTIHEFSQLHYYSRHILHETY